MELVKKTKCYLELLVDGEGCEVGADLLGIDLAQVEGHALLLRLLQQT